MGSISSDNLCAHVWMCVHDSVLLPLTLHHASHVAKPLQSAKKSSLLKYSSDPRTLNEDSICSNQTIAIRITCRQTVTALYSLLL